MESNDPKGEKKLKKLDGKADEAIHKATREALKKHKLAGNPIAVWLDGNVVLIPPDEIALQ